ncbi:MAG: YggU family protein [Myxococcales bacterium]|nr:YggU family protein [Myxococcales bacterium]
MDDGADGAIVSVRVQPRARRSALAGVHGDALKVALQAPPVDGAANEALVKFLAGLCAVPPSSVRIVGGQTSRQKRVLFAALDAATVDARLRRALEG